MKQTAVEWLFNQIKKDIIGIEYDYADELKQAKAMEKEQMIDFVDNLIVGMSREKIEQYYNETYGGNK